jgi:hypothetical protein
LAMLFRTWVVIPATCNTDCGCVSFQLILALKTRKRQAFKS